MFDNLLRDVAHTLAVDVLIILAHAPTNGIQQLVHSAPSVFATKKQSDKSQVRSKQNSNGPSSENFLTVGGYFECSKM